MADESDTDMTHIKEWLAADPPPGTAELAVVSTEEMTDAEYTAFLGELRLLCIAKANEWWPSFREAGARRPQAPEQRTVELAPEPEPLVPNDARVPLRPVTTPRAASPMVVDADRRTRDGPWYELDTGARRWSTD